MAKGGAPPFLVEARLAERRCVEVQRTDHGGCRAVFRGVLPDLPSANSLHVNPGLPGWCRGCSRRALLLAWGWRGGRGSAQRAIPNFV